MIEKSADFRLPLPEYLRNAIEAMVPTSLKQADIDKAIALAKERLSQEPHTEGKFNGVRWEAVEVRPGSYMPKIVPELPHLKKVAEIDAGGWGSQMVTQNIPQTPKELAESALINWTAARLLFRRVKGMPVEEMVTRFDLVPHPQKQSSQAF